MLPDYPQLKKQMNKRVVAILRHKIAIRAPVVAEIRSVPQHEGDKCTYETAEGDIKELDYKNVGVGVEIPFVHIPAFGIAELRQKIAEMAEGIARQQMKLLLATLTEVTEEVGNVMDAEGQPLSAELMLKAWETMHINFDERGQPDMPGMLLHLVNEERVKQELNRFETDRELNKRRREIIDLKREEWRDREADRKLVD